MKRFMLLALAAAMLTVLLTGCAGSQNNRAYRGNVSTTDDGWVNGTNDNMTGTERRDRRSTYGTELPQGTQDRSSNGTWEDSRGRRFDDTMDPNRSGWTSGTGEESAWDSSRNTGRAIPKAGRSMPKTGVGTGIQ